MPCLCEEGSDALEDSLTLASAEVLGYMVRLVPLEQEAFVFKKTQEQNLAALGSKRTISY